MTVIQRTLAYQKSNKSHEKPSKTKERLSESWPKIPENDLVLRILALLRNCIEMRISILVWQSSAGSRKTRSDPILPVWIDLGNDLDYFKVFFLMHSHTICIVIAFVCAHLFHAYFWYSLYWFISMSKFFL